MPRPNKMYNPRSDIYQARYVVQTINIIKEETKLIYNSPSRTCQLITGKNEQVNHIPFGNFNLESTCFLKTKI